MTISVRKLKVVGLHERQDIEFDFESNISIFMGPNGIGKSTILNIFVYALTKQWQKLAKQSFDRVELVFASGDEVAISRRECLDLLSMELSPRNQQVASALAEQDILEDFLEGRAISFDTSPATGGNVSFEARDLRIFRNNILQYGDAIRSLISLTAVGKAIQHNFKSRIVYLPTYRRIEQDISEVLSLAPSMARRIQHDISENVASNLPNYTEFVRFGMDDISALIDGYTSEIKEYSRQQINSLSTRYLTAALQTRQSFAKDFFLHLTDKRIHDILARVDDEELNRNQRKSITDLIKALRSREVTGRLTRQQEQIASYFPMLAETHDRISQREVELQKLAALLNHYLNPTKEASYDQTKYSFSIRSKDMSIPLSGLSSGEKQIVSLFASLILLKDQDVFVVIDEPELSLSVLWQEILLMDIASLPKCKNVLAVTHSPFIYGEKLAKYTRDLSDFSVSRDAQRG